MALGLRIVAVGGVALIASCAVMDPYIRHDRAPKPAQVDACVEPTGNLSHAPSDAVVYACQMAVRLERARSEVVRTRSGLTTVLFPAAGIVAYNSARGFNAPTSTALTAGGLAAYSTVSTLAQADRVRVYNSGLRSISCGIGVQIQAVAAPGPESLNRVLLKEQVRALRAELGVARKEEKGNPAQLQAIESVTAIVNRIGQEATGIANISTVDSGLTNLVQEVISSVNSQLMGTMPSNSQAFGSAVAALGAGGEGKKEQLTATSFNPDLLLAPLAQRTHLGAQFIEVLRLFDLVKDEPVTSVSANYTPCKYLAIDGVSVESPVQQFMLGAGDVANNATIELAKSDKREFRIYGGYPPYSQSVNGPTPALLAEIENRDGTSYLVISPPATHPTQDTEYQVVLGDSMGKSAKTVLVKVKGP